ncbi:hypothetical protein TTHERM_01069310 (macronuclear) [Tetrahymena thermophila SB210]|uniref:Uncharacterized protein n=1 Tax=Tetrahymena thermophila (strain SB210) TaxID=312017 RepID=Q24FR1_TETTS|nr:hypothetical protein TTHERM_01069310 [Tetrahymena thermophila SB210]EAS06583.3 hypothetical protein TTHERM_01069310 [Tetrahymena thermophila SB210]|eukprot:XP_001026828.3 hypothetical protein TTHERM_01069310 [Tetrahymena thermophila SB210]
MCILMQKNIYQAIKKSLISQSKMEEIIKNLNKLSYEFYIWIIIDPRDINCFNFVGGNELQNCKAVEKRNYQLKIKSIYEQVLVLQSTNKL